VGTDDEKELLGRYRRRLEDNIKIDANGIDRVSVDWINLLQDRGKWRAVLNMVITNWFHNIRDIFELRNY
jgi:hypothetical protein